MCKHCAHINPHIPCSSLQDEEFIRIFQKCTEGRQECSFEQFTKFMVSITEDKTTPDQLRESFRAVAGDKVS
jgi:Ca2+-binding EF-hand superfamily protein